MRKNNKDNTSASELFLSDETEFELSMSIIRAGVAALKECKNEEETLLVSEIFFRMKEEEIKNKTPLNDVCIEREKLRADLAAVTEERDRLRAHIEIIAGQPLSSELDAEQQDGADYEGAYDGFIRDARAELEA